MEAIIKGKEAKFIFAGKAIFTLVSGVTGARYTYKITKAKDCQDLFFASLLTGRDNENNYTYLGIVNQNGVRVTKASKYTANSVPVRALDFFIKHLSSVPENLGVYHENKCCCCGRTLTTPESIIKGVGPECEKRL